MLLRVNPGSLHRSKIHGSMFTFTANYEVLLGTSLTWTPILIIISAVLPVLHLNSQMTCNTKSKLSLLSGVWFGSRVPPERHCRKYSSVEDYFNFTFGLYQSDSCLQMNTFKIFVIKVWIETTFLKVSNTRNDWSLEAKIRTNSVCPEKL